jgi:hypothetical protein
MKGYSNAEVFAATAPWTSTEETRWAKRELA